ncbi:hypothetical transcript [Echinococcus multilocularis]|uniref:Hypothetical transcript n=1 Tax=Echinococcus multilocularis TaxID=6211 RepID=A0A087W1R0_ECHMU|nr:hypothetical transcript [Echinococcus multilocularis]
MFVLIVLSSARCGFSVVVALLLMDDICPVCHKSGIVSQLYSVSVPSGTLSGLCSNPSCIYPFDSYSGLLHSLAAVAPADASQEQISSNLQGGAVGSPRVLMEAPNQAQHEEHLVTSQAGGILDTAQCRLEVNDTSLPVPMCTSAQKPCAILPRYLADSLKQASLRSCGYTASSSDSGVSSTSTSSLSYHETLALRVQQRASRSSESSRTPRCASLLEKYTRQNGL